jgi:AraC-like DNA-binding protein
MELPREVWRTLRTKVLSIYDHEVDEVYRHLSISLPNFVLWFIRSGEVEVAAEGKLAVSAGENHWVLLPPGLKRQHAFRPGSRIVSCHFSAEWASGRALFELPDIVTDTHPRWNNLLPCLQKLMPLLSTARENISLDEYARLEEAEKSLATQLASLLQDRGIDLTSPTTPDPRLQSAVALLAQCNFTGKVPYPELKKACALSRVQIDRLFKSVFGLTPKQVLDRRRLQTASELLLQSACTVKEVCFRLDFSDPPHFCHWFHRQTGYSPQEYRRVHSK